MRELDWILLFLPPLLGDLGLILPGHIILPISVAAVCIEQRINSKTIRSIVSLLNCGVVVLGHVSDIVLVPEGLPLPRSHLSHSRLDFFISHFLYCYLALVYFSGLGSCLA